MITSSEATEILCPTNAKGRPLASANFCGVAGLSSDDFGYLRWKGAGLGPFSFSDKEDAIREARVIGAICMTLEASGQHVDSISLARYFEMLSYGEGCQANRFGVVWRIERSGPLLSVRPIATTDRVEGLSDSIGHSKEANLRWGTPAFYPFGGAKTSTVVTREDYLQLVDAVEADFRSAAYQQWPAYEGGVLRGSFFEQLEAAIPQESLLTRSQICDQLLGAVQADLHKLARTGFGDHDADFDEPVIHARYRG